MRVPALALLLLAATSAADAADNTVVLTPGTGVTLRSKDVGSGVESLMQILGDTSGNPLATAPGSGNSSFALPIQGVASGVAIPSSVIDGGNIVEGLTTDAASTQGGTGSISAKLRLMTSQLNTLNTNVAAAVPALNATAYNTNSYSTGQTSPVNVDLNGNVYTNGGINRWAGTTLGAPSNYGTSPGAVEVPGVNAFATNLGTTTNAGAALVKGGVGVVNGGSTYQTVAASQTAQVLQTSTGAAGDYLSHCVIQPTTTAAGTVIVYDNATAIFTFTAGTLSNLAPIAVPFGAVSSSGAWKVTTNANEIVTCYGKFSSLPSSLLRAFG